MTSYRTPLFFAQAVGSVVRARRPSEAATVFLPAVRPLLALAAELETERNHVMPPPPVSGDPLDPLPPPERETTQAIGWHPPSAEAACAHVLHGGRAITGELTAEDEDFLGFPGLLSPEQTAAVLASRDEQVRKHVAAVQEDDSLDVANLATWRDIAGLRHEVHQLVGQVAARTGRKHADIHTELRRDVAGPPSAAAPLDVLPQARRDWLLSRVA